MKIKYQKHMAVQKIRFEGVYCLCQSLSELTQLFIIEKSVLR